MKIKKFDFSYPASERRNMHCSITVFLRSKPKIGSRIGSEEEEKELWFAVKL